ncbi:hypothetical protein PENSPDRAFT_372112 [Peniophora sp. CONT]|nr:hypothetical protein PENSPDRAFT_372112 [Peniophora sp. CONT]
MRGSAQSGRTHGCSVHTDTNVIFVGLFGLSFFHLSWRFVSYKKPRFSRVVRVVRQPILGNSSSTTRGLPLLRLSYYPLLREY